MGALADRTQKHKWIIIVTIVFAILLLVPLPWVPHFLNEDGHVWPKLRTFVSINDREASRAVLLTVSFMVVFSQFFVSPMINFTDTRILELVEASPTPTSFGQVSFVLEHGEN